MRKDTKSDLREALTLDGCNLSTVIESLPVQHSARLHAKVALITTAFNPRPNDCRSLPNHHGPHSVEAPHDTTTASLKCKSKQVDLPGGT